MQRGDGGGAAAAGGIGFQARCVAWFAARLLAAAGGAPLPALWSGSLRRIDCETGDGVDDIRVTPHSGPPIVLQAKRTIDMSTTATGEMAKTVRQFVVQHLAPGHDGDRLVLITSPSASGTVRDFLRTVLDRTRTSDDAVPFVDVPVNSRQRKALDTFIGHVRREWQSVTSTTPTDEQVCNFLKRCHVVVLDIEPGGAAETSAVELLATLVAHPTHASITWKLLVEHGQRLAADRSGTDRPALQRHIVANGVGLLAIADYRADIARLEATTERELVSLEVGFVTIPGPAGAIRIDRAAIADVERAASEGPLLVVGDPGCGKTVALYRLARHLLERGLVLFLPVGSFTAGSAGALRDELGLDHDLLAVLAEWAPGTRKVVVMDALDAARGDAPTALWQRLIDDVAGLEDWHVVASVRTWDLQRSVRLKRQFPLGPVVLGDLTTDELTQAATGWPELEALVAGAPEGLWWLLENPFNLRLAAELLLLGTPVAELSGLRDRLALLDVYWQARVLDDSRGVARDGIVAEFAHRAIIRRSMTVPVTDLIAGNAAAGDLVDDLLSRSVLVEASSIPVPGAQAVRVAHHVLFDYVVSRTFNAVKDALATAIATDPNLLLFAQPSVQMHLERVWRHDRAQFWSLALRLVDAGPGALLAAVAAAQVVTRNASDRADLEELIAPILAGRSTSAHMTLLRHIAIAFVLGQEGRDAPSPGIWPAVAEQLSTRLDLVELPVRIIIDELTRNGPPLHGDDLVECGRAARRWLEHLWSQEPTQRDRLAISAVIATAASDPMAVASLLRRALEPDRLISHGATDLLWICEGVPTLIGLMADFVADLYITVLGYEEASTDATAMYQSRILGLTSNRRQDVDAAKHELVSHFPVVLSESFSDAIGVLATVVERDETTAVTIGGRLGTHAIRVVEDGSDRHEARGNEHDPASMVTQLEQHLASLADRTAVATAINEIAAAPRPIVIWRAVLRAGACSELVAAETGPLAHLIAEWAGTGLASAIAALVQAQFASLDQAERERVEAAVVALDPGTETDDYQQYLADQRYRQLLHALDISLASPEVVDRMRTTSVPVSSLTSGWLDLTEHPYGLDLDTAEKRALWALIEPVESFAHAHFNDVPDREEIAANVSAVESLVAALEAGVSASLRERADAAVAGCARVWTYQGQDHDPAVLVYARALLLHAAKSPLPRPDATQDAQSLGLRSGPRVAAARGLACLARFEDHANEELATVLSRLSTDPVPTVRLEIVRAARWIGQTNRELAIEILSNRADDDPSDTVLRAVVVSAWNPQDLDVTFDIVSRVATRTEPDDRRDSALECCHEVAALGWTLHGYPGARSLLTDLRTTGKTTPGTIAAMLHEVREAGSFTAEDADQRMRTFELCSQLIDDGLSAIAGYPDLTAQSSTDELATVQAGFKILDLVAHELFFASGVHDAKQNRRRSPNPTEIRFAAEAADLFRRLAVVPHPSVTHHLVEALAFVLDARPARTLELIRVSITAGGTTGRYELESLAVNRIVSVVERILTDHRDLLQQPDALNSLREILEIFVNAGWPAAHRLAFGLEQIFR